MLSFLALLGLFYISTFIDRSEKIFKGRGDVGHVADLLFYMTPQFVYYVIPIAALLSALVTFGVLARSSELTVMKACGISLYRIGAAVVAAVAGIQRHPVPSRAALLADRQPAGGARSMRRSADRPPGCSTLESPLGCRPRKAKSITTATSTRSAMRCAAWSSTVRV